ncbi:MAG: DEAD/DEAH box helicase [Planctomycetes bacterium]|nr:DEAD/DEAH box helicase [Planctomycetota bacterium]
MTDPHLEYKGFVLYPFQADAIAAIEAGKSVVVAAPTGAGKTLIAEYTIDRALQAGRRLVYTAPIKTLSNQKFRDFSAAYPGRVGIMTGDVTVNPAAPVLIMTTEIFRNTLFEDPARLAGIEWVVFDEIHFVDDAERGTVWEESIIFAPEGIKFVGLSATIPNIEEFAAWMQQVRRAPVVTLCQRERPVPLVHRLFTPRHGIFDLKDLDRRPKGSRIRRRRQTRPVNVIDRLERDGMLPCLYFSFSRRECEMRAEDNAYRRLLGAAERSQVLADFEQLVRRYRMTPTAELARFRRLIGRGIAYHHAGLLPTYKEVVEHLFTSGRIKLLFTTETFALGVNMPARTVVFHSMYKFNGVSFDVMSSVEYNQMAGRAGRQGIDREGLVVTCLDLERDDPGAARDVILGELEPVVSKFQLGYSAILNLHERVGHDIFAAYDASFKSYQERGEAWQRDRELLDKRLTVLRKAGYIDGERLTEKGRFASRVYGFEVQLAELFEFGFFRALDEIDILLVLGAVVFEPRRGDPMEVRRVEKLGGRKQAAEQILERFLAIERALGLRDFTRGFQWGLSRPIQLWAAGASVDDLARSGDMALGDLVRYFRLTLQLIRQFKKALHGLRAGDLPERLELAAALVNRDEVDAEQQLLAG